MEQKIYDVLCDIHKELSNLRSDMADIKLELKNIQGYDEEYEEGWNLNDVCDSLSDIQSDVSEIKSDIADVKSELDGIQGSGDDTANLYELWDKLSDIKSEVVDIYCNME